MPVTKSPMPVTEPPTPENGSDEPGVMVEAPRRDDEGEFGGVMLAEVESSTNEWRVDNSGAGGVAIGGGISATGR